MEEKRYNMFIGGRRSFKQHMMQKFINKFMDENPHARILTVKANGEHEVTENADFEIIEPKLLPSPNDDHHETIQ